jgi:hypothetical protein
LPTKNAEEKIMRCKICGGDTDCGAFCSEHMQAYTTVLSKFEVWRKSFKISWEEYLSEIEKHSLTGEWAKEVAKYMISNEEVKDGKEI